MPRIRRPAEPLTPAAERTLDLFDQPRKEATPPTFAKTNTDDVVSVARGVQLEFIRCACGLQCSVGVFTQWGWRCQSCGRNVAKDSPRIAGPALPRLTPQTEEDRSRLLQDIDDDDPEDLNPGLGQYESKAEEQAILRANLCGVCGARLTQTALGEFYPCGHSGKSQPEEPKPMRRRIAKSDENEVENKPDPELEKEVREAFGNARRTAESDYEVPKDEPKRVAAKAPTVTELLQSATNTVTVTWAEETFSPQQFHAVRVGPFHHTVEIQAGETPLQAMDRAMEELLPFAEKWRARKRKAYAEALKEKY